MYKGVLKKLEQQVSMLRITEESEPEISEFIRYCWDKDETLRALVKILCNLKQGQEDQRIVIDGYLKRYEPQDIDIVRDLIGDILRRYEPEFASDIVKKCTNMNLESIVPQGGG